MKMMKLIGPCLLILLVAGAATGCKKESTPTAALNEKIDLTVSAPQSSSGGFSNGPYGAVTGSARVYLTDGKYQLDLENFNTSNGPDLKVYISKEQNPAHFVNLGSLKSTSGNQVYDIPTGVDPKDYTYALIFCQQYSHLFGYTQLTF
jgi:hypothetical protein